MNDSALAFIPARGGSKGVPGKNKRVISGKPLIYWSIEVAKNTKCISSIIVSSDDEDILDIARHAGVTALRRPPELANDTSPVIESIHHAMRWLTQSNQPLPEVIVLLQPTAPLRLTSDIQNAVSLYYENNETPVCSVLKCEDNHPARMYTLTEGHVLKSLQPEAASKRRQDLPPVYLRNGSIYVFGQREVASGNVICERMIGYEMPRTRSINIDTELDLAFFKFMAENYDCNFDK
jgi:CMP-N,N'-diacetyllegionaminic acid synthase